jgi:beta-1,4-mannosyl-glycoprotein beta-1,4-N-acetylglucosaminyltransferase
MKFLVDCFTFYNEIEILELRFLELYNIVDKFIIVEANKTFKGDYKPFVLEENKWRFKKWWDKVAHIKIDIPDNLTDAWSREKYQRNSFIPFLYSMKLRDYDVVMITDVDEIPNPSVIKYIKEEYNLNGIFKLEMETYFGSLYNKEITNKWYHPKIMNWKVLNGSNPEDCRLNFNCQFWEKGGWHFTYFGGPSRIANKINHFSHQEYNRDKFKDEKYIEEKIKNGEDLFGEWRKFERINPEENNFLPSNWRILEKFNEKIYQ